MAVEVKDQLSQVPMLAKAFSFQEWDRGSNEWAVSGEFTDSGNSLGNSTSLDVVLGDVDDDGDDDLIICREANAVNGIPVSLPAHQSRSVRGLPEPHPALPAAGGQHIA